MKTRTQAAMTVGKCKTWKEVHKSIAECALLLNIYNQRAIRSSIVQTAHQLCKKFEQAAILAPPEVWPSSDGTISLYWGADTS